MAIASTIKEGATTVAASGGTDVTLVSMGIQGNTNTLYFSTDTNLATRRLAKFTYKPTASSSNSPGGYSLARNTVKVVFPKVLANEAGTSQDFIEVTVGSHPESTQAEVESRLEQVAQFIGAAAFMDFYKNGNLT
jgi:NAD(P)H-dependent FMN reductase